MRMASCPKCGLHNVNGVKNKDKWYSKCFNKECNFITEVGMPTRKISRYNWNRLYEHETGEELPDDACGRQERAFMKKELKAGLDKLVDCFTQEDFAEWEKHYNYADVDWVKKKGKHRKSRNQRVKFKGSDGTYGKQ